MEPGVSGRIGGLILAGARLSRNTPMSTESRYLSALRVQLCAHICAQLRRKSTYCAATVASTGGTYEQDFGVLWKGRYVVAGIPITSRVEAPRVQPRVPTLILFAPSSRSCRQLAQRLVRDLTATVPNRGPLLAMMTKDRKCQLLEGRRVEVYLARLNLQGSIDLSARCAGGQSICRRRPIAGM